MWCSAWRIDDRLGSHTGDLVEPNLLARSSQVSGCYPQLEREGGGLVTPGVLEVESKSILSGYLDHRLTQDVGINLRDEEGIMDRDRAPPGPLDHPGHDLYGHVRILAL